jgi:hypothetical protein
MLAPADPLYEVDSLSSAVTVMPIQRSGDIGVYSNESTDLVKQLRSVGVDASFLDPADHREWRILMSADVVQEFVIAFMAGIASKAAWVGVGALLRKRVRDRKASVRIVEIESTPKGFKAEWFKVDGDGPTIEAALIQRAKVKGKSTARPQMKAGRKRPAKRKKK